jgi:hypothetical protein
MRPHRLRVPDFGRLWHRLFVPQQDVRLWHQTFKFRPIKTTTGTTSGWVWRRKAADGRWEYRAEIEDESDFFDRQW